MGSSEFRVGMLASNQKIRGNSNFSVIRGRKTLDNYLKRHGIEFSDKDKEWLTQGYEYPFALSHLYEISGRIIFQVLFMNDAAALLQAAKEMGIEIPVPGLQFD